MDRRPARGLRVDSFAGYGKGSQARWGAPGGTGDSFCVFTRSEGQANTLTQTATGLTPGKIYTLQFVTADYKDMVERRVDPKQHKLRAILGDGATVTEKPRTIAHCRHRSPGWVFVAAR